MVDWAAWVFITGWHNFKNRDLFDNSTVRLETVVYIVFPFDYEYNFRNWIIYHTLSMYFSWNGCMIISVFNSLNFMYVYHLIGHIKILKHKLKTDVLDEYSDEEVRLKLVDLIEYHSFIIR